MKIIIGLILILNTIHTGKGMKAAPNAKIDDGLIDIILLPSKISRIELLKLLPKLFTGKHILSEYVEYVTAKTIQLYPENNEILNIDGEIKSKTPVSISVIPQKFIIYS